MFRSRFIPYAADCARQHWWTVSLTVITVALSAVIWQVIIWPAYTDPICRMYTSRLGYATVLRKQGKPFPVTTAFAERREIQATFMGEGLIRSEPIQVPLIATSRILKVHAQEGDFVKAGQLLVELDTSRLKIKIEAAKATLATAKAEYQRTRIGSDYVLEKELPERAKIRLLAAEKEAAIRSQLDTLYDRLAKDGLLSQEEALLKKIDNAKAFAQVNELKQGLGVASSGRVQSLEIAAAAIREAELTLEHRENELRDYRAYAPADGVVEQCLIHEGEYNQDPGRPAFLIASGLWFEAFMDQTAIGKFQVGAVAHVRLEAYPSRVILGKITRIKPVISYSSGGPETNRPMRPMGTGAPEWPATFSVRIELQSEDTLVVPGLTGFVRIGTRRNSISVPQGAITRVSGNKAIVFVVDGDGFAPREVTTGHTSGGWTAVNDGLEEEEEVITNGHQVLEPGDRVMPKKKLSADKDYASSVPSSGPGIQPLLAARSEQGRSQ